MPAPDRRQVRLMPSAVEGFRAQRIVDYKDNGNALNVVFELGRISALGPPLVIAWPDVRIVPAQARSVSNSEYEEMYAAEEAAGRLVDGYVKRSQALIFIDSKGWFPWLV